MTGAGFVTLAATLSAFPNIPVAGLALLLGVDRFMSEARSITNLIGNAVATMVIARWEGSLDMARVKRVLAHGVPELHDERLDTVAGNRRGESQLHTECTEPPLDGANVLVRQTSLQQATTFNAKTRSSPLKAPVEALRSCVLRVRRSDFMPQHRGGSGDSVVHAETPARALAGRGTSG